MKYFLLFLGIIFTVTGEVWAQRTFILSTLRHKSFVSLNTTYSKPTVSPFGKNTQNSIGNGQSMQISAGHRLGWNWGVVGSYTYCSNPVRKNDLLSRVRENIEETTPWQSTATNCTLQSLLAGPMFTVQANRFIFDLQLTVGYAQATSSHMELSAQYRQVDISYTTPAQTIRAPAAGAGLTARYKIYRWLALHGSAQYVTADLKYDNLYQERREGRLSSVESIAPHQPLALLNLGGGLSFLF